MLIQVTYMYVCVYPSNMVCLAGQVKNQLIVCAQTSIFSSPPELSLQINLPPPYPYPVDLIPLQSGWSMYTRLLPWLPTKLAEWIGVILVRTCRMGWDFLTKLTRGQSLAVVGPLLS
jgi:hypothetical protein